MSESVCLNNDDKDLDFILNEGCDGGKSIDKFMWSGCRANYGIKSGKAAFLCKVESGALCRVGWSTSSAALALGQCDQSFGYGGTAKKSNNNQFITYGEPYRSGDAITALVDCDSGTISFMKNGDYLGVAFTIPDWLRSVSIFPHVLTKDAGISLNFGESNRHLLPPLPRGYTWLSQHPSLCPSPWGDTRSEALAQGSTKDEDQDENVSGLDVLYSAGPDIRGAGPNQKRLVMLVGLPCSGKTFWAKKFIQQHPEMKFQILSTNLIMERKMPNTKHMYGDRFQKLIKEANETLTQMLRIASSENGNIIWDQTNVYPSARKRKLSDFKGFFKTAVVFLPDLDTLDDWRMRQFEQTGQRVPDQVVAEMQRQFILPEVGDAAKFDEVVYAFGNSPSDRRQIMQQYKMEADAAFRGEKRPRAAEVPEDAPYEKASRKDEYIKSYGERQFAASNPYRPELPYNDQHQALLPAQRQAALVRDVRGGQYHQQPRRRFTVTRAVDVQEIDADAFEAEEDTTPQYQYQYQYTR